jgi:hypothetical protein
MQRATNESPFFMHICLGGSKKQKAPFLGLFNYKDEAKLCS